VPTFLKSTGERGHVAQIESQCVVESRVPWQEGCGGKALPTPSNTSIIVAATRDLGDRESPHPNDLQLTLQCFSQRWGTEQCGDTKK
jgi:hypothetical protein